MCWFHKSGKVNTIYVLKVESNASFVAQKIIILSEEVDSFILWSVGN
jgi:hypothetical protein